MRHIQRQLQPDDSRLVPEARLILALLIQGLRDAMNGDPGARVWLASRDFDDWCAWIDLNPDALRRRMAEVRR